jgi:hypothetical protein
MRIIMLVLGALLACAVGATAQTQTKTIGTPQQPKMVPSLIVLNAKGVKLDGRTLVLEGVSPNAIVFADRPIRAAGHVMVSHLLEEWSSSAPDSFAKEPPNATVSALDTAAGRVADMVVVLKAPKLDSDRLVFEVTPLEGALGRATGPAAVFIDIINLPLARRTGHRAAWYAGAKP